MSVRTWAVGTAGLGIVLWMTACTPASPPGASGSGSGRGRDERSTVDAGTPPPGDGGTPAADAGVSVPEPEAAWEYPPLQTSLSEYALEMTDAQLQYFRDNPDAPEVEATFVAQGVRYPARVRLRGASARHFPKKSWNVDLGDGRFEGRRRLNLVAEYQDQTLLVEKLAYDLLAAMKVPAPKATYVRLRVNGQYEGVFLDLEQVDKHFVKARAGFADEDPTLYRCGWKDCELKTWKVGYQGNWTKKTNETEPNTDIQALMELFNHAPEAEWVTALEGRFELEHYLRSMALDVLISNNYVEDSESYFVHDRVRGKWSYVPWDLNNADPRWWPTYTLDAPDYVYFDHPLFNFTLIDGVVEERYAQRSSLYPGYLPVFSNLGTRVLFNPELRARLEERILRGQKELFADAKAHARIDAMYALIAPHMLGPDADHRDPYFDLEKFKRGPTLVRRFVSQRNVFIADELARLRATAAPLRLTQVNPAQGWVELTNVSGAPVALGGKTLTQDLRHALLGNLPARTLAPGETARFDMTALGVPLRTAGEVGLFDGKRMTGVYDLLFYGPSSSGANVHVRDAEGRWQVR